MNKLSISIKRKLVQLIAALLSNANFKGFASGTVYSGKLKQVCVPGLNCYSCPGALGSCPLGALQSMLADPQYKMSFYVIGVLAVFGLVAGRWICGWLCPFGLLQELLHLPVKIAKKRRGDSGIPRRKDSGSPLRKNSGIPCRKDSGISPRTHKAPFFLRYTKHALLLSMVILLPIFLTDEFGFAAPYFCQWLCPSGTIMGAMPLFLVNPSLAAFIGPLFYIKASVAAIIAAGSFAINRFFCKFLCPLGAIYGLFNRFALTRLVFYGDNCIKCGRCADVCGMNIDPREPKQHIECICCGKCVKQCSRNALRVETPKTVFKTIGKAKRLFHGDN